MSPMKKILIFDENAVIRALIKNFGRQWETEVVAVDRAEAAVDAMCGLDPPQILFVDWDPNDVEKVELVRSIRQFSSDLTIYIIVIAESNRSDLLETAFAAGADDFLVKPFEKRELRKRVLEAEKVIARHESATEAISKFGISE